MTAAMTSREEEKRQAAQRALGYVEHGSIIGVGTGSTVAHFIDALGAVRDRIEAAVSSSEQSTARLQQHGIRVIDLNSAGELALYVDGADECDPRKCLIKGGGAAMIFSRVSAAPPPLIRHFRGSHSSAPSTYSASSPALLRSMTRMPCCWSRAVLCSELDTAASMRSRTAPSASMKWATVEPVPTPMMLPCST